MVEDWIIKKRNWNWNWNWNCSFMIQLVLPRPDGKICMSKMLKSPIHWIQAGSNEKKSKKVTFYQKGVLPAPEFSGNSEEKYFACSQIHGLNKSTNEQHEQIHVQTNQQNLRQGTSKYP